MPIKVTAPIKVKIKLGASHKNQHPDDGCGCGSGSGSVIGASFHFARSTKSLLISVFGSNATLYDASRNQPSNSNPSRVGLAGMFNFLPASTTILEIVVPLPVKNSTS